MITPEEFNKFELLFEKLKLLILSDCSDKFYHINQAVVHMVYLKNEGNKTETAKDLGLCVKTLRTYLKETDISGTMMDMHLNMLALDNWFNDLPEEDRIYHRNMVKQIYETKDIVTQ